MLMLRQIYLVNKKQIPLTLFEMSVLTGERWHAGALAKCISRILPVAVLGSSLTKVTVCGAFKRKYTEELLSFYLSPFLFLPE